MVQLTYPTDKDIGNIGALYDNAFVDTITRVSEEAAAFSFGVLVRTGTDQDEEALLPTLTGQNALGVAQFTHATEIINDLAQVQPGRAFNILRRGRIIVLPEETVVANDPVFVRVSGGTLGQFRMSDPGGSAALQITKGAKWYKGGDATTPAVLEVFGDMAF